MGVNMIFAFDLDGVIANLAEEIVFRLEKSGMDISSTDELTTLRVEEAFPELPNGWFKKQREDSLFWRNCMAIADAWYTVNGLFHEGHDIYIITARPCGTRDITEQWLIDWDIMYNRVLFSDRLGKREVAMELGCDIAVEDDPHEARLLAEVMPTVLKAWPYNLKYEIGKAARTSEIGFLKSEQARNALIDRWKNSA